MSHSKNAKTVNKMVQNWTSKTSAQDNICEFATNNNIGELLATSLIARNLDTCEQIETFLTPDLMRDWTDPKLIPGMLEACNAVKNAIDNNKHILVFGDFDVDGITATACMLLSLRALGATPSYVIPSRLQDGYGLTDAVIPKILELDPDLVITVDCGVSAHLEVAKLRKHNIDVVITDHHEPQDILPGDAIIADPKLDPNCPAARLAGVGVALKLIALLGEAYKKPDLWRSFIDLVALGTLADLMPLNGENRSLVAQGLKSIAANPRAGIAAILQIAKRPYNSITSTTLSFAVIPRLNAAGRMGDPTLALELLLSCDQNNAKELAFKLDLANTERRSVENELVELAKEQALDTYNGENVLIVSGNKWHEGVRGIVASRLSKHYGVPVIVFSLFDGIARGSGRSVGDVNLFKYVSQCSDLTIRYGGHAAAVGITIKETDLRTFSQELIGAMSTIDDELLHPPLCVDGCVNLKMIDIEAIKQLNLLEPYGNTNPNPSFVACGLELQNAKTVGFDKKHLAFSLNDGEFDLTCIWFNCPQIEKIIAQKSCVDAVFELLIDEWNSTCKPKAKIIALFDSGQQRRSFNEPIDLHKPSKNELAGAHKLPIAELADTIVGRHVDLLDCQSQALKDLGEDKSLLVIMATGRGKSLIFQTHCARLALDRGFTSVFVYPLRALIADQYLHLKNSFKRLGLSCAVLTGDMTTLQKDAVFADLYTGKLACILTTPEYLQLHAWRFRESQRINFLVFDEAHHIGIESQMSREAFCNLSTLKYELPDVQVMAVTATSNNEVTRRIVADLELDKVIVDVSRRDNLALNDMRNCRNRTQAVINIITNSKKSIIYVNSRSNAIDVARALRKANIVPGQDIVFYHAGLNSTERKQIEAGFQNDDFAHIISTSAFGEGINVANVRDVILYHLPLNALAFNQMSGRAGRDGLAACIHLLFGSQDASFNQQLLASGFPTRDELLVVYKTLKELARARDINKNPDEISYFKRANSSEELIDIAALALLDNCRTLDNSFVLNEKGLENGLGIFAELGLIDFEPNKNQENNLEIRLYKAVKKVELENSTRYIEGIYSKALLEDFCSWVFASDACELLEQICGPLTPDRDIRLV